MYIFERLKQWLHEKEPTLSASASRPMEEHLLSTLLTLAWYVEARDPYTGGHLWRVSRYAFRLAQAAGFASEDVVRISLGGFLHDLGKIGVPDAILRKPGRLTDEEYAVIQTHPDLGERLLAGHPLANLVKNAVLLHHERPDGKGYPFRLEGAAIPIDAKIVAICDAYDAMTSHRPYRAGMSRPEALAIISSEMGAQFDRVFAEHFLELGYDGYFDHIQGHSDDGIPLQICPMCGPTLVVRREQLADDFLYCRNCGGEFVLKEKHQTLHAQPTGLRGSPTDLEPMADRALISRVLEEVVKTMPLSELLRASHIERREPL